MATDLCPPAARYNYDKGRDVVPRQYLDASAWPLPSVPMPPPGHTQYAREALVGGAVARPVIPVRPPFMPAFPPPPNVLQPNPPAALARRPAPQGRGRYGVHVSDIRNENLSEADARQLLSRYVVIRMEKKDCSNEVDEEGYAMQPTWRLIERAVETVISQQEATRKAPQLMRHGPPVGDKKSDLGPAVQRQIQVAQQDLERAERDSRYHYVLAQLDSKLRRIEVNKDRKSNKCKCTLSKTKCKCVVVETRCRCTVQTRCNCSPLRMKCKCALVKTRCKCGLGKTGPRPKYERVSVTTYFKRTPRPNENALAMLQEEERLRRQPRMPVAPSAPVPQPLPHYPPLPTGIMPPPQPPARPQLSRAQMLSPSPSPRLPAGNAGKGHDKRKKPIFDERNTGRTDAKPGFESPSNSPSSSSSRDSESSGYSTARSSFESSSRRSCDGKGRSRSRHRVRDRPGYFGVEVPRRHSRRDEEYLPATSRAREHQDSSRRALAPVIDVRTARGRAHPYVEDGNEDTSFTGLAPKVIQISPPLFRRVPDHEARRQVFSENLAQMQDRLYRIRLEEEARSERDARLEQDARLDWQRGHLDRGQRLGDRLRRDLVDDPGLDMRHVRESARHREQSWQAPANPFMRVRRRSPYRQW
ncbi:hypothetical protein OCS_01936 [Ophiocordyceps sinensis CO18]|uniref:Uncharacterized protein n=1 Tax=Ophiocordyceps sinensis (strain Co18 / CGMCC 3.14243) TaxID=911162 RepID=T5AA49_OPHSC|nr:hypothetical protein OCS_01936 [Ophiocordyceps sinensis CO18]